MKILKDRELSKTASDPIKEVTQELRLLAANMMATMILNNGIGLAACQVGKNLRLIVFDCATLTGNIYDSGFLFNPLIIDKSEETNFMLEGCLSFPKEYIGVVRHNKIKVEFLDLSGKTVVKEYGGLASRIVQHEIDHLNGITMHTRRDNEQDLHTGNLG